MSRVWPRLALLAFLAFLVSGPAHAYRFGTDETIHKIEDVKLKGAKDEALFLGYMTRIRYFLAGLYVEDVGYVLGVEDDSKRFYHIPEGEELKSFQRSGYLPDPLPPYKISIFDYIIGYSLWWALALGALFVWLGNRRKRAAAAATGTPGAPETPGTPPPSS